MPAPRRRCSRTAAPAAIGSQGRRWAIVRSGARCDGATRSRLRAPLAAASPHCPTCLAALRPAAPVWTAVSQVEAAAPARMLFLRSRRSSPAASACSIRLEHRQWSQKTVVGTVSASWSEASKAVAPAPSEPQHEGASTASAAPVVPFALALTAATSRWAVASAAGVSRAVATVVHWLAVWLADAVGNAAPILSRNGRSICSPALHSWPWAPVWRAAPTASARLGLLSSWEYPMIPWTAPPCDWAAIGQAALVTRPGPAGVLMGWSAERTASPPPALLRQGVRSLQAARRTAK